MKTSLDARDLLLIDLLTANARRPLAALAREIGLSRSATQERLQRLESSGVVRAYRAEIAWPERESVEAWLVIKLADGVKCAEVVPKILKVPEVRLCHALAGDLDLLVRLRARNAEQVSAQRDALSAIAGVGSVTTHVVLAAHRD